MHWFDVLLPITAAGLIFALIVLLVRRRYYRSFPWFLAYLCCAIAATVVRLSLRGDYTTIYKVFWTTEAVYAIFALMALHEVFRRVFRAFYLFRGFWLIFPVTVVAIVLLTARGSGVPLGAPLPVKWVISAGVTAKYVECALFVIFVGLTAVLNITWRSHAFAIVQGFVVSALGAWFAYRATSEFGIKNTKVAIYSPPVAYIFAVLIWLFAFLRPEPPNAAQGWLSTMSKEELLIRLKQNTTTIWRLIRKQNDS